MLSLRMAALFATPLALATSNVLAEADPTILAGLSGAILLDSGTMSAGAGGPYGRSEVFELLRLEDGRHVLLNTITAESGAYRVRVRFDLDAEFRSVSADGMGLYDGTPVRIAMRREDKVVAIRVEGDGIDLSPTSECDPDCFINTSPSMTAMFVMTRHYDHARGGRQPFQWAGQDLDRERTLSGGRATLAFEGMVPVTRADGQSAAVRHYTFLEELPTPEGGTYTLDFDLWTLADHRPLGFAIQFGPDRPPIIGFREGWSDVRAALTERE